MVDRGKAAIIHSFMLAIYQNINPETIRHLQKIIK